MLSSRRLRNTGLVSGRVSPISWQGDPPLALVDYPSSNDITIKIPHDGVGALPIELIKTESESLDQSRLTSGDEYWW